jgi:molecular chaperone DnaK (HSP70)
MNIMKITNELKDFFIAAVDKMVKNAEEFAKSDKERSNLILIKKESELLIYDINLKLEEFNKNNQKTEEETEIIKEIENLIKILNQTTNLQNIEEIKFAKENLENEFNILLNLKKNL